ncbi:MAG: PKD domain-containing protein [Deltaproteobacteria bacterium]|nr:PKD domain-containing protein [Deltaproteobacteria bacterium]
MTRTLALVLLAVSATALIAPNSAQAQVCGPSGSVSNLNDGDSYLWDIDDRARVWNGTIDAFDVGMELSVDGTVFPASAKTVSGREITVGPAAMSGLSITRKVYVSDLDGWARWVDLFENTSGADITVAVDYQSNPGSDSGTVIGATSSGDTAFTVADNWVVTDDFSNGGGDPTLSYNIYGGGTLFVPTSVAETVFSCASTNGTRWDYGSFTVPAGRTLGLMSVVAQNPDQASAQTHAGNVQALSVGLDGLSPTDRGAIVNWLLPKNILFVADSSSDTNIPAALTVDGHTVTSLTGQYSSSTGATAALTGSLSAYDVVYWSATGTGFGSLNNDALMIANLEAYVAGGGRVYVTGYDSIDSPDDPVLAQFVGGTGPTRDVPSAPAAIANVVTSLTYGLVDTRGVTPTGAFSDRDALTALASGTIPLVQSSSVSTESQWVLRPLGAGEVAYVSNGQNGTSSHASWTDPTSVYNASLRNFAFGSGGGVFVPNVDPVADAGGPYAGLQGASVSLDGSASTDSDGTIVSYDWDCETDGVVDVTGTAPTGDSCTYSAGGAYTVTLTVTDDGGATATATATATIDGAPTADAGGPYAVDQGVGLTVDGSASSDAEGAIVSWDWDCDTDGVVDATGVSATCTYTTVGTATLTLTVTDGAGLTNSATSTVTVSNVAPVADAGGPYTGDEGAGIAVDGSASTDLGGIVDYAWDCDTDGVVDVSGASATASCAYPDQGTFTVSLVVTDNDGATATATGTVTVANVAPAISSVTAPNGDEGATLSFSASAADVAADTVVYGWDFGDGNTDVGAAVTHVYANNGAYTVTVTASDEDGGVSTSSSTVTIGNVAPTFTSVLAPTSLDEGSSGSFSAVVDDVGSADVPSLAVTWSWGDGTADDAGLSATHTYDDDGTFTVTISVTDQDGGVTTQTATVVVANIAPVITSSAPTSAIQGTVYSYVPTVVDPGAEVFVWTLSASASSNTAFDTATGEITWTPDAADAAQGTFNLVLDVVDGDGGADSEAWTVTVSSADSDGDGMPDDWETANGLNPNNASDAALDPDFDGATNLDEYNNGTDPASYDGPSAPVANAPLTGDEVAQVRPSLVVDNATDPQGDTLLYTFEVYSDAGLTALVTSTTALAEDGSGQTPWEVDLDLAENTEYWWRAAASDAYIQGAWSTEQSFFVNAVEEAPDVPVLVFPIDDEVAASLTPTLSWSEALDPDGDVLTYDVEVYDDLGVLVTSTTGVSGSGSSAEWVVDVTLTEDAFYDWTVRAVDDTGLESAWAELEGFLVSEANEPPTDIVFTAPEDGGAITDQSPALVATESTDAEGTEITYFFEVDSSPSFDSADYDSETVAHTGTGSVTWDLATAGVVLPENQLAYARVQATDGDGINSTPDVISFFVRGDNDAPDVPVLVSPEDGAIGGATPDLVATEPADSEGDPVRIEFIVARDMELTDVVTTSEAIAATGDTTWTVDVDLSGDLYWSARALDDGDAASDWAAPFAYSVEAGGDDDDSASGDDDDDDDDGTGCDCASSVAGDASPSWMLLLLPLAGLVRRRR